jgi:hypothetical protein
MMMFSNATRAKTTITPILLEKKLMILGGGKVGLECACGWREGGVCPIADVKGVRKRGVFHIRLEQGRGVCAIADVKGGRKRRVFYTICTESNPTTKQAKPTHPHVPQNFKTGQVSTSYSCLEF